MKHTPMPDKPDLRKFLADRAAGRKPAVAPLAEDELLTASQAARKIGVCTETIRRRIKRGQVPVYRLTHADRIVRVKLSDLLVQVSPDQLRSKTTP